MSTAGHSLEQLLAVRTNASRGAAEALQQREAHLAKWAAVNATIEAIEREERATTRRRRFGQLKSKN
ncbi:MAG TPA: hypothetical protein VHY35_12070, partial [Stellaceae bacterium]|nr:hypothetical protein [Stellaceae bacterium]